jgi:tripartite-type tricarboxylate transporter receptor subunit TctC
MLKVPRIAMTAWLLAMLPAGADEAAFFRGKTIQFTSAFAEGGLYATVTRLVSEHLPRHLPGRPGGIAVSMPGAAGLRQMNHLYNVAPKDGTVIALMYDNVPMSQAMQSDESIRFDARRFGVLGSVGRGETALISILKRTGVASLDDARRIAVVFGATGTTSGQYYLPSILNRLFGTRIRIIPGYKTMVEILLSMERGELDGVSGAFGFLALARIPGKMLLAPPAVPAERLAVLRDAFASMVRDPVFVADVARTSQRLEPRTWQDAERIIRETIETPPEVVAHVRDLLKIASP